MAKVLIVDDNAELAGLLSAAVESRGFTAVVGHSGAEAARLIENERPVAAIVDLLLPDMRGTEVLRALAAARVPAVAISGVYKGTKFVRETTTVYGARAFFEKPFETRALLEVVSRIAREGAPPARDEPLDELTLEEIIEDDDVLPLVEGVEEVTSPGGASPPGSNELGPHRAPPVAARPAPREVEIRIEPVEPAAARPPPTQTHAAPRPVAKVALSPRVSNEVGPIRAPSNPPAPRAASASDLPFGDRKVWSARRAGKAAGIALRTGSLGTTSVARLFTAIYQARQTGEMRLRRKDAMKLFRFDSGLLAHAASNLEAEQFGALAVRRGTVTAEQYDRARAAAKSGNLPVAQAMREQRTLDEASVAGLLADQVRAIVWSVLEWTDGEYGFTPGRLAPGLPSAKLTPATVVLEGVRRDVPLAKLREHVGRDLLYTPRPDPPYDLQDLGLSDDEARVVAYADGTKTVDDLLVLTEAPERAALAVLHALAMLGILEARKESVLSRRIVFT